MDAKLEAAPSRMYEEFEPISEWVEEEDCNTLLLYIPGFGKEQVKVQVVKARNLIIHGERTGRDNRWRRFSMELPISANCDTNKITAKFEGGILYVRQPKLITSAEGQSQKPKDEPQPQMNVQDQGSTQKTTPVPDPAKQTDRNTDELANAKNVPEKLAENEQPKITEKPMDAKNVLGKTPEKEKNDADNVSKMTLEEGKRNGTAEDGTITAKTSERLATDSVDDAKRMDGGDTNNIANGSCKTGESVGILAIKLKKPRQLMNWRLLVLVGVVVGLYVSNSIRSCKKVE